MIKTRRIDKSVAFAGNMWNDKKNTKNMQPTVWEFKFARFGEQLFLD